MFQLKSYNIKMHTHSLCLIELFQNSKAYHWGLNIQRDLFHGSKYLKILFHDLIMHRNSKSTIFVSLNEFPFNAFMRDTSNFSLGRNFQIILI